MGSRALFATAARGAREDKSVGPGHSCSEIALFLLFSGFPSVLLFCWLRCIVCVCVCVLNVQPIMGTAREKDFAQVPGGHRGHSSSDQSARFCVKTA